MLAEKVNIINDREKVIAEKQTVIAEKDKLIEEKETAIELKDKLIDERKKVLLRKNSFLKKKLLRKKNWSVRLLRVEIQQSFSKSLLKRKAKGETERLLTLVQERNEEQAIKDKLIKELQEFREVFLSDVLATSESFETLV